MAKCRRCGGYQDDEEGGICPHCGSAVCFMAEIPGPLLCGNTGRVVRDCACGNLPAGQPCAVPVFPRGLDHASRACGEPARPNGYCDEHQHLYATDPFARFDRME